MNLGLERKRIVVSGAANGIGTAIFQALLEEGAYPIGIDIEPFKSSELERKISGYSEDYLFFEGDASDKKLMRSFFRDIDSLDGLVNNAGLLGGDSAHGGRTQEAFDKMMDAHVRSAYVLTELSHPKMTGSGSIVNIGSIELDMAQPDAVLYTTCKGALWGMTMAYTNHLAPRIRVNMVSPGNVNTERNKAQYGNVPELIKGLEGRTPLKRSVEPQEVADLVVFLLSPKASAITGQNYRIDCGYTTALWDQSWTGKPLENVYEKPGNNQ
jgi:NAD(P)-dependent dehydrogenase (short-subunit alcohol dehydrogenase family)